MQNICNFHQFNNLFEKYNLTINNFNIEQISILKNFFEKNTEKLIDYYKNIENKYLKNKNTNLNTNVKNLQLLKENKKYFNDDNYFLSNYYFINSDIQKIYNKYINLNKPEDNLFLRSKWIENQHDNGNLYYSYLVSSYYKKIRKDINIKDINEKIKNLSNILKDLEKNKSENNKKQEKGCLYKFNPIIIKNKEKDIKDKKLENGTIVFYEDNIFGIKNNELINVNNIAENTLALVEDTIWIFKKNKWEKSDNIAKFNNIKYLCEFNNLDIKDIQLDKLDCIYRKDFGCNSKISLRLEEHIQKIKDDIENLKKLEIYLKDDSFMKEINKKIENMKIIKSKKNIKSNDDSDSDSDSDSK
jgi:hypothetical protein